MSSESYSEKPANSQPHRMAVFAAIAGAVVFLGLPLFGVVAYWLALQSASRNLMDSADAAGLSVSAEGRKMLPFGEFTVSRTDSKPDTDETVTLRLSIGVAPNDARLEQEIQDRRTELRAAVGAIITENGWHESQSVASRLALRTALVSAMNGILKTGQIQVVAFSEILE